MQICIFHFQCMVHSRPCTWYATPIRRGNHKRYLVILRISPVWTDRLVVNLGGALGHFGYGQDCSLVLFPGARSYSMSSLYRWCIPAQVGFTCVQRQTWIPQMKKRKPFLESRFWKTVFGKWLLTKVFFWWSKKNPHKKWRRTVSELIQTDKQASRNNGFFNNIKILIPRRLFVHFN